MLRHIGYKEVIKFTWHYWRKRWKAGLLLVTLMISATMVDTFSPIYTGKIVDALAAHPAGDPAGFHAALKYLGIFACLSAGYHAFRWMALSLWARFAVRNMYEILTDAMHKVQRFSSDWHANTFAGATVRKITRGMWAFDVFGDTLFMGILPAFIIMIGMTSMLLVQLPYVGMFVAVMVLIYCSASIWMSLKFLKPKFQLSAKSDTEIGATLADIITGNPTVKSFGLEKREDNVFNRVATRWRLRAQNAWLTGEATNLVRGALRISMLSGMIVITIFMWSRGEATPGDIALSLTSFFLINGYLRDIGQHITNLQKSISEMEDVIAFWLRRDELADRAGAKPIKVGSGEIVFENVGFIYKSKTLPLFENLNLTIRPGEKIALVGQSGSGKTTLTRLIQRLYDVTSGEICIDGQNIADVTQESLRATIALVPQEPILFHRSLSSNIAYGRPRASMAEIIEASQKAYAHEFIKELPLGYDTLVGERGVKLSGGERQRVAIARAILADTPILLLDEATSSLDSISEHYIQMALEHLMKGRTTITVAHRLSTIQSADRILVFKKGVIIEQGSHEELIALKSSHYRELYEMQGF
ncbi:MAG: ABC transporter ATP-binding protein [Alphaproteobacteria bacterium]